MPVTYLRRLSSADGGHEGPLDRSAHGCRTRATSDTDPPILGGRPGEVCGRRIAGEHAYAARRSLRRAHRTVRIKLSIASSIVPAAADGTNKEARSLCKTGPPKSGRDPSSSTGTYSSGDSGRTIRAGSHTRSRMLSATAQPLLLVRQWLAEDHADGLPWEPERFAQYVHLAVRETGAGRSWRWAIIETAPAWRRAYLDQPDGGLEYFSLEALRDDSDTRAGILGRFRRVLTPSVQLDA